MPDSAQEEQRQEPVKETINCYTLEEHSEKSSKGVKHEKL